jgi:hypothetical protein
MGKVAVCCGLIVMLLAGNTMAATEEAKDLAIDNGLAWLAGTQTVSGPEGYWPYSENGTLAATASAALAFVEEGHWPGKGTMYDDVVTRAVTYIFNRATVEARFGVEMAGYQRYAEDYNNDGIYDDGNDEAIYFEPTASNRRVYTTGLVAPLVYALGESLGTNTVVGIGSAAISGKTYAQAMQDIADWFSWAQVEPDRGNYRGGWRYDANYSSSDNSTAQWGALPLLYAQAWGLGVSDYVYNELELWINYIQNVNGGSGYDSPGTYVNVAKTGGLLLELAAIGALPSDARVVAAVAFINSRWNNGPSGTWYGNLNHPYAMWAVYKGLQVYDYLVPFPCGTLDILVGEGIPAAPGGFTICFDASPATSAAGDWYSHYCDYLVSIQSGGGSWSGYSYWTGALATGWYINILKATRVRRIITVDLDIKPTSCPNPLNTKSNGVLPVAILGTEDFDVYDVDPATVTLAGVAPLRWAYEDVATPFEGELCDCHELGPDGYMDMTLKFDTQEIVAALGAVTDGEYRPLTLEGEIFDGALLRGEDCVWIKHKVKDPVPPPAISVGRFTGEHTIINLSLSEATEVSMVVYDVRGKQVRTVVNGTLPSGDHRIVWDGRDSGDNGVANGVYFCRVKAGAVEETVKMILTQ